ncbi:rRNA maturation RNase YbeY [Hydrogenothermus marinus]|uniref:Endoribonuclease YbeY n=1 Tax=Hydrogenothermus marinus TaxID=133270 RepID=A0A3M0BLS9_9AQUI|nr:rRNA maturation RNase YbeY [Hydrogenothermus marinus]RMA97546.1 putative rRNA maturation factor [Hydrogenothermus marinus]
MNKIIIDKQIYDRYITKAFIKDITNKILNELNLDKVEIGITLTDNKTIQELNKQWRNKDKPTDVLSFPIDEKPPAYRYRILGDIVISLPFAKKQAEEIDFTYKEEVLRLLTHGILHLLGYDHETSEEDAKIMFDLQDKIFEKVAKEIK